MHYLISKSSISGEISQMCSESYLGVLTPIEFSMGIRHLKNFRNLAFNLLFKQGNEELVLWVGSLPFSFVPSRFI